MRRGEVFELLERFPVLAGFDPHPRGFDRFRRAAIVFRPARLYLPVARGPLPLLEARKRGRHPRQIAGMVIQQIHRRHGIAGVEQGFRRCDRFVCPPLSFFLPLPGLDGGRDLSPQGQRPWMFRIDSQDRIDRRRCVGKALFGQGNGRSRQAEGDLQLFFRGRFLGLPLALPLGLPLESLEVRSLGA